RLQRSGRLGGKGRRCYVRRQGRGQDWSRDWRQHGRRGQGRWRGGGRRGHPGRRSARRHTWIIARLYADDRRCAGHKRRLAVRRRGRQRRRHYGRQAVTILRLTRDRAPRTGFTLLEMILALAIGLVLLGALYQFMNGQLFLAQAGRDVLEEGTLARAI